MFVSTVQLDTSHLWTNFVEEGHERATRIITEKRSTLDTLAGLLQKKEVLSGEEVSKVMEKAVTCDQ